MISNLVVDGAGAYWATSDGKIMAQPTGEKAPRTLAQLPDRAVGLALAGSRLLATHALDEGGVLVGIPRAGGPPAVIAKLSSAAPIVVDDKSAYLAADDNLLAISLATGEARQIAHVSAAALALDATNVFFATESAVLRVPKRGGTPFELAEGMQDAPSALLVVQDRLYFIADDPQGAGRALCAIPRGGRPKLPADSMYANGGTGERVWNGIIHAVTDGSSVFWTVSTPDSSPETMRLLRRSRGSAATREIAKGLVDYSIAVFGTRVFWVTPSGITSIDKSLPGTTVTDESLLH